MHNTLSFFIIIYTFVVTIMIVGLTIEAKKSGNDGAVFVFLICLLCTEPNTHMKC